jgi:hypothetical protein
MSDRQRAGVREASAARRRRARIAKLTSVELAAIGLCIFCRANARTHGRDLCLTCVRNLEGGIS